MTTALKLSYSPGLLVSTLAAELHVDPENVDTTKAFLSASSLLIALGVEPDIDPDDATAAAEMVRGLLLESKTRTTTRSRRSL